MWQYIWMNLLLKPDRQIYVVVTLPVTKYFLFDRICRIFAPEKQNEASFNYYLVIESDYLLTLNFLP